MIHQRLDYPGALAPKYPDESELGPRVQHYVYAVVNSVAPPETPPLYIANTRAECRAYIDQRPDAVGYRIKRGKLVLYGR